MATVETRSEYRYKDGQPASQPVYDQNFMGGGGGGSSETCSKWGGGRSLRELCKNILKQGFG